MVWDHQVAGSSPVTRAIFLKGNVFMLSMPKVFTSPTYFQVSVQDMVKIIQRDVRRNPDCEHNLIIGSDSQSHGNKDTVTTKYVLVVAVHNVGKGGIFFYHTWNEPIAQSIRQKLTNETQLSLLCAEALLDELEKSADDFDYTTLNFSIHVDAGRDGASKELIPELVGWVRSEGWYCETKPDSFVASTIADKISK